MTRLIGDEVTCPNCGDTAILGIIDIQGGEAFCGQCGEFWDLDWNNWNNQNITREVIKMTKKQAREKAQWEADFYNQPTAVITSAVSGFATETMNPNIPENEIIEICQPSPDRGNRGSQDIVLDGCREDNNGR